jgi:histidinol phosphatase-like PHP family hydrolase
VLYDFHTHSFLSDGELLPMELIRQAVVRGCSVLGISDHVSDSTAERVINESKQDARLGERYWPIQVVVGAEITHVPAAAIGEVAGRTLAAGAQYVVCHGETISEPVEPGTNRAAIVSGKVDILAHPGLITLEDAKLAAENDVFLEISCRKGHCLANGRVAQMAREAGAKLLVNTDSHLTGDLLTEQFALTVAQAAGLNDDEIQQILYENPKILLERIRQRSEG